MNYLTNIFMLLFCLKYLNAKNYNVTTSNELIKALSSVTAGDSIKIFDGIYTGNFKLIKKSGSFYKPIIISGLSKNVILTSGSIDNKYAFYLNTTSYIILDGFSLTNSSKGLMIDFSNNILINNINVFNIGQEGVHFRSNSSNNTIQNSFISYTGLKDPGFGEGVYIGSAYENWINDARPDLSNNNQVLNNYFGPNITAECIDIKEATRGHLISGNYFNGFGMSGIHFADSWIDCKGNNNLIINNIGNYSLLDGFQVHDQRNKMPVNIAKLYKSGCNNRFEKNKCSNLGKNGKCVQLKSVTNCKNSEFSNIII